MRTSTLGRRSGLHGSLPDGRDGEFGQQEWASRYLTVTLMVASDDLSINLKIRVVTRVDAKRSRPFRLCRYEIEIIK